MEHFGFLGQRGRISKLSPSAYGVGQSKKGNASTRHDKTLQTSEINIEFKENSSVQLQLKSKVQVSQLQQKYQQAMRQIRLLKDSNTILQHKNRQLESGIQQKTTKLQQIEKFNGKFLKQADVLKLQFYMTEKQRELQQLTEQLQTIKNQNKSPSNDLFDIVETNSTYDIMEEKVNDLARECTSLRKEIELQSEDLFYYQQKLRIQKSQTEQLKTIIEQKEKTIQTLMRDKDSGREDIPEGVNEFNVFEVDEISGKEQLKDNV